MKDAEYTRLLSYIKSRLVARKLLGKPLRDTGNPQLLELSLRDIKEKYAHEFKSISTVWINRAMTNIITIINNIAQLEDGRTRKATAISSSSEDRKVLRLVQKPKKKVKIKSTSSVKMRSQSSLTESDPLTLLAIPSPHKRSNIPAPSSSGEAAAFHETLIHVRKCDDGIDPQYTTLYSMSDLRTGGTKIPESHITIDDISWDVFLLLLREDGFSPLDEDQIMYQLGGEPMIVTRERVFKNCIRDARSAWAPRVEFWIQPEVKVKPMPRDNRPMEDQRRARLRQLTDISRLNQSRN
jgi:hypothetical protein